MLNIEYLILILLKYASYQNITQYLFFTSSNKTHFIFIFILL